MWQNGAWQLTDKHSAKSPGRAPAVCRPSIVDRTAPGIVPLVRNETGFDAHGCGERHDGLPFTYDSDAPAFWTDDMAVDGRGSLDKERCVIGDEQFFVHARLRIPVTDADIPFEWGVWVSLSQETFRRMVEQWEAPGREYEPPYLGWLATDLALYQPSTAAAAGQRAHPAGGRAPHSGAGPQRPPARDRAVDGHHDGPGPADHGGNATAQGLSR